MGILGAGRGRWIGALMALLAAAAASLFGLGDAEAVRFPPLQGTPVPVTQVPATATGRLLYTSDGGLWTWRLGDAQPTQIVSRPRVGMILTARWAPDGSRLAYAQYEVQAGSAPVSNVYVANADGSNPQAVLSADQPGAYFQAPVWTADGRQLYYFYSGGGLSDPVRRVERVDLSTGERTPVFDTLGQFDVSPDGRWLAIAHAPDGRAALTLVDLQSGDRTALVAPGPYEIITAPRFNPTSQTILFSGLNWAAGSERAVPAVGTLSDLFQLSVAYAHGPPEDLYTIPVSGGTPTRLTSLLLDDPVGAWAPDGSHLAMLAAEFLAILPAGTKDPQPIMAPGSYGSVDWAR